MNTMELIYTDALLLYATRETAAALTDGSRDEQHCAAAPAAAAATAPGTPSSHPASHRQILSLFLLSQQLLLPYVPLTFLASFLLAGSAAMAVQNPSC